MASVGSLAPAQAHGGQALLERLRRRHQHAFEFGDAETWAVAGIEPQRRRPKIKAADRVPLRFPPSGRHRFVETVGERRTVCPRTSIVFARRDIAAATGAVNLFHSGHLSLAPAASKPGKIRRNFAGTVVTHWMHRVKAYGCERGIAIPEAQCFHPGINQAFACRNGARVPGAAGAIETDRSVTRDISAVGGNFLDPGLSGPNMRAWPGGFQRFAQGACHTLYRTLMKFRIAHRPDQLARTKNAFGLEIGDGRVVLMHPGDNHTFRTGSGRLRQDCLPSLIGVVSDLKPVHAY